MTYPRSLRHLHRHQRSSRRELPEGSVPSHEPGGPRCRRFLKQPCTGIQGIQRRQGNYTFRLLQDHFHF